MILSAMHLDCLQCIFTLLCVRAEVKIGNWAYPWAGSKSVQSFLVDFLRPETGSFECPDYNG